MTPKIPHIEQVITAAKLNMKQGPELLPTFFVGNDSSIKIIATQWETTGHKDAMANLVESVAKEMGATFIIFVAESWMIDPAYAEDFMNNRDKYPQVMDYPHKVEKVIFQIETESQMQMGSADILADRELGEVKWTEPGDIQGRFANLLGQKETV